MRYIHAALAILALVSMIAFSVQNLESVEVSFLSWSLTVPKFLIIAGMYVLGMITGAWLFDFLKYCFKSNTTAAEAAKK